MYRRRPINRTELPDQIRLKPGTQPSKQSGRLGLTQNTAPPLSLQDLSLLRVINDVDSYPVELLSSLPRWLRYLLLSNLPVLDLCRLDHTPVARGVDIDKIWTARVEGEPEIRPSFPSQGSGFTRPAFIESLFQMNVYQSNGSKVDDKLAILKKEMEMEFQGLYDDYDKEKFMNDKEEYLVKLTAHALSCSDIREVAHRLASLRGPLLSKQLQVTEKNIWEMQATSLAVLGLRYPTTYCQGHTRVDIFLTPHRLLPICENADSTELLSLLTHTCKIRPISVCLDIDLISQSFLESIEAEKIIMDNGLAVTPERVSCLSMINCLLENVVILRVESRIHPNITGPMIALVEATIGNGKLKSIFCSTSNLYMEIVQPFCNLFQTKTFHMLHLELGNFSTQAMIKLLQAYMTAPCDAAQNLVINFRFSAYKRKPPLFTNQQIATLNVGSTTVPECAIHHKMIQTNLSDHILLYLLLLPCVRLAQLLPDYSINVISLYMYHLCACHPNLHIKRLMLNMYKSYSDDMNKLHVLDLDTTIGNDIQILLNKPTLEELTVIGDWEGCQKAKKGLIQGLQQQKTKPELQLKSLTLNMLGYSDEEVQTLLEVIVSFPEDHRPRVYREEMFTDAAKKLGTYSMCDKIYTFQDGFVSKKKQSK